MFGGSGVVIPWAFFCVYDVVIGVHRMDATIKNSSSDLNPGAVTDGRYVREIKADRGSGEMGDTGLLRHETRVPGVRGL